jgi:seryl-tRNA synthetase
MMRVSEDFNQIVGLPHRVLEVVSGGLNNAASQKYHLEAWFPFQVEGKELVSASNCTDYQTRELEVRYGTPAKKGKGKEEEMERKQYVHALNAGCKSDQVPPLRMNEKLRREIG